MNDTVVVLITERVITRNEKQKKYILSENMRDMMLISFIHLFQVFGFDLGTFNVSKASRMGRQVIP